MGQDAGQRRGSFQGVIKVMNGQWSAFVVGCAGRGYPDVKGIDSAEVGDCVPGWTHLLSGVPQHVALSVINDLDLHDFVRW